MRTVLFWDIDGTLLSTGRAGVFALEEAARLTTGRSLDLSTLHTAGLTDAEIAREILARAGLPPEAALTEAFLREYEKALPERLGWRTGRVLPRVREILHALHGRADVASFLLTGNTRAGAAAKLEHYGLQGYFLGGAFADGYGDRSSVARHAMIVARKVLGAELPPRHTYLIGDTPHDIACGRIIGARTIAVATGAYNLADLIPHGPWAALERLPPAERFFALLNL